MDTLHLSNRACNFLPIRGGEREKGYGKEREGERERERERVKGVLEERSCNLTTPQFLHALWLQTEMIPFLPFRIEYARRASLEIYIYAQTPGVTTKRFTDCPARI